MSRPSPDPFNARVRHEDLGESLETSLVILVETPGSRAVEIQHAEDALFRDQGNDNLGPGSGVAGDVARKLVDVGYHERFAPLNGSSAHAFADRDAHAGGLALEGANDQLAIPQKIQPS
jgi:hypothetical protein